MFVTSQRTFIASVLFLAMTANVVAQQSSQNESSSKFSEVSTRFVSLLIMEDAQIAQSLDYINKNWQPGFAPMAVETLTLARRFETRGGLLSILQEKTGQSFGFDLNAWFHWIWKQDEIRHTDYAEFKSLMYGLLDAKFRGYFNADRETRIRLDEVRWGGVMQDGIPPLRQPKMLKVSEADYLDDSNVVFGVEINGDARAYPKRILAWHEMFVDEVGGTNFAGVYCTLCGTVILYKTLHNNVQHAMGTSGFLYRSNKLMYDADTQSLWSTMRGEPVIGPLVGKDIRLERSYLVTTTWGEWRKRHPDTTVLSLDTGHQRNYGEGIAYEDYFATDDLMFTVPELDTRLNNKDEVLALWFAGDPDEPLAISADYLRERPVYQDKIGETKFVVLTDKSGANRVYESSDVSFKSFDGNNAIDNTGVSWSASEHKLESADGKILKRLPAHRAFWFGWFSAFANTRLVYDS